MENALYSFSSDEEDRSMLSRLDDAYECGKDAYQEGKAILQQVSQSNKKDSIMNDEPGHKKCAADSLSIIKSSSK
jgi:hypothetical protein